MRRLHRFHIDYMVTKDGGAAGGFAEKAGAAAQCGVQLIVLRRPDEQGETAETILQAMQELYERSHWWAWAAERPAA